VIALVDYGAGNLRSVHKALLYLQAEVRIVKAPDEIGDAAGMILPGVGAFDDCLNTLRQQDLLDACKRFMTAGKPFLGICVGYQALFDRSEEFNSCAAGLEVFGGSVVRFTESPGHKIPQIGWNQVEYARADCPLFRGIPDGTHFYFVHSYYPKPSDLEIVAARTTYGDIFASAVWRDNVFATQFHPEKSQRSGLKLLENFLGLIK